MRIFVAGGTGVIGRRVVPALIAAGHELVVLARNPQRAAGAAALGAQIVQGDALDAGTVKQLVAGAAPDLIMHQLTDLSERSTQANARLRLDGTRNLFDAALAADVGAIVLQSIAWAYAAGSGPATEHEPLDLATTDPQRRFTVAAIAIMEDTAAEIDRCVLLRNGLFYGPDSWYAPGAAMAEAAHAGALRRGPDITSFVHVDDAAAAAAQSVDWPAGAYNVVDDEPVAADEWVPAFCAAVGAPAPAERDPDGQAWARGASNARARERGWSPAYPSWRVGFASGLAAA
ncbi:MAG TPA: NAD(P)-dependent oxidoreductase [Solirubrobacteraceae bacterium]|nr:NAD(P)-dependent oxidoreductase [Solirubrobacteraceae bacterium]